MDENCLLESLSACCCKCGHKDDNGETCNGGEYVVKEHGCCQDFSTQKRCLKTANE
ncbi:MAG: hypothetical protein ACYCSQ_00650 [bacterium]